jgi:hypothetical protein
MIGRQARIIATMLLGAMLIAAGILFFFPAHAGVSCWTYKTQWGRTRNANEGLIATTHTEQGDARIDRFGHFAGLTGSCD